MNTKLIVVTSATSLWPGAINQQSVAKGEQAKINVELAIGERRPMVNYDSQLPDVFCLHSHNNEIRGGWSE